MTMTEPIPVPTNDLLNHVHVTAQLHGNEVAWVRSISGSGPNAIMTVGLGVVTFFGRADLVRERLAALLGVVDSALAQPELWPDIALRADGPRRWRRARPNPFVALGNGNAGPENVRPVVAAADSDQVDQQ